MCDLVGNLFLDKADTVSMGISREQQHCDVATAVHAMPPAVPPLLYTVLGVRFPPAGEAARLRWRSVELGFETLGRGAVTTSYDSGTRTDNARCLPSASVHQAAAQ
jgi:hypothetical protein